MPIIKSEDAFEDDVKLFPGLLSALLYCDLDETFCDFVRTKWGSLNDLTGEEILILVPQPIESQLIIRPGLARLVRPFRHVGRVGRDIIVRTVSEHFGVSLKHFPCIVFFGHPSVREAYCFSFRHEKNVDEIVETMKQVIALARGVVSESRPRAADEAELRVDREEMMQRLTPRLRRAKIFRSVRKLAPSRVMANVVRLAGGLG